MSEKHETPQEAIERLLRDMPKTIQTSISTMRDRIGVARRTLDNLENDLELLADVAQKLVFASDIVEDDG